MSDSNWQKQVDWMRANGVVSAKWTSTYEFVDGIPRQVRDEPALVECILGPITTPERALTTEEFKAQLEKQKKDAEDALDLLDFGAS